jgi:hypothetical protein
MRRTIQFLCLLPFLVAVAHAQSALNFPITTVVAIEGNDGVPPSTITDRKTTVDDCLAFAHAAISARHIARASITCLYQNKTVASESCIGTENGQAACRPLPFPIDCRDAIWHDTPTCLHAPAAPVAGYAAPMPDTMDTGQSHAP